MVAKNKKKSSDEKTQISPSNGDHPWLSPANIITGSLALIACGFFFGGWYIKSDLAGQIAAQGESFKGQIAIQDERLKGLTERLNAAGVFTSEYKKSAVEKGFKNPAIIPVGLVYPDAPIKNPPIVDTKGKAANVEYNLIYELVKVSEGQMYFRVDGNIGSIRIEDGRVVVPLILDKPVEITFAKVKGGPRFYAQVIATPTTNSAIVAIGPKEEKATS